MTPLIQQAIQRLRNKAGWWEGDPNAERILEQMIGDALRPVSAALSFDPKIDRDLECCARRIYNERLDYKEAADKLKAKK